MQIIKKEIFGGNTHSPQVVYKASFTTSDGLIHRVDFNKDGRIENLCIYNSHEPNVYIDDLKQILEEIKKILSSDNA